MKTVLGDKKIDDGWLHGIEDAVPEELYTVPIGKGDVKRKGNDVTIVAVSYMVQLALKAAEAVAKEGIDVEVIDLRSIKPIDKSLVLESIEKTGRLVIGDVGWKTYGLSAEISAMVTEKRFEDLKSPILRVALPDVPAPAARTLEDEYYPTAENLISAVKKVLDYSWSEIYIPGRKSQSIVMD